MATDEELIARWQAAQTGGVSDDDLRAKWQASQGGGVMDWLTTRPSGEKLSVTEAITGPVKALTGGAGRGTAGLMGLAADVNPFQLYGPFQVAKPRPEGEFPLSMDNLRTAMGAAEAVLPEQPGPDDPLRYVHRVGEFIGPGAILRKMGAGGKLLYDTLGGLSSQGAEDLVKNLDVHPYVKTAAPIVGGIFGTSAIPVFKSGLNVGKDFGARLWRKVTPYGTRQRAAEVLKEVTDLSADQIDEALKGIPDDELSRLMGTAELTDDAGMAQIQKEVTKTGGRGAQRAYDTRLERGRVRDTMLDDLSDEAYVDPEDLGLRLRSEGGRYWDELDEAAKAEWGKVPNNVQLDVTDVRDQVQGAIQKFRGEGSLGPSRETMRLVNQLMDGDSVKSSKFLKNQRTDALHLSRNLDPKARQDKAVLDIYQGAIDKAMKRGLPTADYAQYRAANEATKYQAGIFGQGRIGGTLLDERTAPIKLLQRVMSRGDKQSIAELKDVIKDPAMLERVKRGVIDLVPRDTAGMLTPAKMAKFIRQKKNSLVELFGDDHYNKMVRITDDLLSEAKVDQLAFAASKGQSVTAQSSKMSTAIRNVLLAKTVPGGGLLGRAVDGVLDAVGMSNAQKVEALLLEAAFDPKFAAELLKTPTRKALTSTMTRLNELLQAGKQAPRGAALGALSQLEAEAPELEEPEPTPEPEPLPTPRGPVSGRRSGFTPTSSPITEELLDAVRLQESGISVPGGRSAVESHAGAIGPYQFMPATAREFGVEDPTDEVQARAGARRYLEHLYKQFGDLELALAAYNAGPGRTRRAQRDADATAFEAIKHLFKPETQNYVPDILARLNRA